MELDRPHHRPTPSTSSTSSELFICLTSRLSSSSSMKIAKSILSPGRARDPPISLSTSLSRRLRTNGSIKGGQASPMFPTGGKKRGCSFENPEPSSPKVTCIGQVRVKTKKKVKQTRSLSRRRSGEMSFRKVEQQSHDLLKNREENVCAGMQQRFAPANSSSHFQQQECLPHRNQRWVHLPETICEALRAFGAEFSCLFPCGSSCLSTSEGKEEKANGPGVSREEGNNGQSSCGAVCARWFVALQDCEGGKGREIELVVGGDEERTEVRERTSTRSSRRHVFEDIDFKEETIEAKGEGGEEEEKARLSICIPPKNALLLMRCRSDPMKMASLANRFWESPAPKDEDEDGEEEEEEEEENLEENKDLKEVVVEDSEFTDEAKVEVHERDDEVSELCISAENDEEVENKEKDANLAMEMHETEEEKVEEEAYDNEELQNTEEEAWVENEEAEAEPNKQSFENHVDQEMAEKKEENPIQEKEIDELEEENSQIDYSSPSENSDEQDAESETEKEAPESNIAEEEENEEKTEKSTLEEETQETSFEEINEDNQTPTLLLFESDDAENAQVAAIEELEVQENDGAKIEEKNLIETKDDEEKSTSLSNVLPDCLLLMMCEPKLSMEVSKETWVCSTDFIRWLPERPVKKKVNNVPDEPKKRVSTESKGPPPQEVMTQQQQQQVMQPPRSSCSLPAAAAVSMAAMIEQKLVNAVAYEPFVLTRCKSEPMRTAAAKLMPEACFWNNRKLEPHRSATFGVGAAGVGF